MKFRLIIHVDVDLMGPTVLQLYIQVFCVDQVVHCWYSL
jgi:hypothetical protein